MEFTNNLKRDIDYLQTRIVPCYESDNILLIFDNQAELLKYKRKHNYMTPNKILIAIDNLHNINGLKYKQFHFMTDDEMGEINVKDKR